MLLTIVLAVLGCAPAQDEGRADCTPANADWCFEQGLAALSEPRPRYKDARTILSKACLTSQHGPACHRLGVLVRDAKGGPQDLQRAADLFRSGCKARHDDACIELGIAALEGRGLKQNAVQGVELLRGPCADVAGNDDGVAGEAHPFSRACVALGRAYANGQGVIPARPDPTEATAMYLRACDAGYAPGCVEAAAMHGTPASERESAVQLLEHACKLDPRVGCYELAEQHEAKTWPGASDANASLYFQKACNVDATRGCFEAAELMRSGRIQARDGEIEYLYNLACEHGHTEACASRKLE